MNKQIHEYLKEQIDWFVTTDQPMSEKDSKDFLMALTMLAYQQGGRDELSESLKQEYKSISQSV